MLFSGFVSSNKARVFRYYRGNLTGWVLLLRCKEKRQLSKPQRSLEAYFSLRWPEIRTATIL
ncbi:hypothetical protein RchiOBHm_Chr5g0024691 [Rosa chinensis]|uniref:Uncharacterized protein n=1 Tax=Rosa chinensis TaxID=74649 RepID=A0A2P6Q8C9_ROSCH|nr:hypothetical protein RchiOBHm_Chr5g0024691 [Rosa chinensis]